jgi:hypothetical protein
MKLGIQLLSSSYSKSYPPCVAEEIRNSMTLNGKSALSSKAFSIIPNVSMKSVIRHLHPRIQSLLQDDFFIRSAIATASVVVGVVTVHRLWFIRQVRDVEKDAKEEELPMSSPPVADESDTELWEEEEPDAAPPVADSGSHWEFMSIHALIAARFQNSLNKEL